MSDFDPYYKWLGIPPEEQPPNHYRLLGIPLFTGDSDVIANAADQRMLHVRSFQSGPRSAISQKLLNEIAHANACLLRLESKSVYDEALRAQLAEQRALLTPPEPPPPQRQTPPSDGASTPVLAPISAIEAAPPLLVDRMTLAAKAQESHRQSRNRSLLAVTKLIAGSVAGLVIGYLLLCFIAPDRDFLGLFKKRAKDSVASEEPVGGSTIPQVPERQRTPIASDGTSTEYSPAMNPDRSVQQTPESSATNAAPKTSDVQDTSSDDAGTPLDATHDDRERLTELVSARDAAIAAGDVDSALNTVALISRVDGSDALEAQLNAARQMQSTADPAILTERLLQLLDEAFNERRRELALQYVDDLLLSARKADDPGLLRRSTVCVLKIQESAREALPKEPGWIDLLAMVDVGRDAVRGNWTRTRAGVVIRREGCLAAQLAIPSKFPKSYDLDVEFTRIEGDNDVSLTIPVGERHCLCILSGWHGEVSGLQVVDGKDIKDNVTSVRPGSVVNNRRHSLRISVELTESDQAAAVFVDFNGKRYITYQGPTAWLSVPNQDNWRTPPLGVAQLCAHESEVVFHSVRMRQK